MSASQNALRNTARLSAADSSADSSSPRPLLGATCPPNDQQSAAAYSAGLLSAKLALKTASTGSCRLPSAAQRPFEGKGKWAPRASSSSTRRTSPKTSRSASNAGSRGSVFDFEGKHTAMDGIPKTAACFAA
eukprot:348460-Pyramimonas_sp.AAC.1